MDSSLPGPSVNWMLQARILEWIAISLSRDLPDPGIKPGSPAFRQTLYLLSYQGEEEKLKFYIIPCSSCLSNPACSFKILDHVGLRKWGLTILGTGAYFTHPCPALCNRPSPCKPVNPLNHACPCIKKTLNPFVWGSELGVLASLGPPA